jgi:hypothetical protein
LVVEKANCSAENGRVRASGARRRLAATGSGIGLPYFGGADDGILAPPARALQGSSEQYVAGSKSRVTSMFQANYSQ